MENRLEIKGLENTLKVIEVLMESGYSIHLPYLEKEKSKEEQYNLIEYSFVKYGEPSFIMEKE